MHRIILEGPTRAPQQPPQLTAARPPDRRYGGLVVSLLLHALLMLLIILSGDRLWRRLLAPGRPGLLRGGAVVAAVAGVPGGRYITLPPIPRPARGAGDAASTGTGATPRPSPSRSSRRRQPRRRTGAAGYAAGGRRRGSIGRAHRPLGRAPGRARVAEPAAGRGRAGARHWTGHRERAGRRAAAVRADDPAAGAARPRLSLRHAAQGAAGRVARRDVLGPGGRPGGALPGRPADRRPRTTPGSSTR